LLNAKIGVIGAGLMGHGIAYRFAVAGHDVGVFEPSAELRATLPKRLSAIADLLGDDPACLTGISVHDQLALAVKDASLVVEAAPEKVALKQQLFVDLEANVATDTILASNSSAIPSQKFPNNQTSKPRPYSIFYRYFSTSNGARAGTCKN
jgi:3-hydroxybutyryl-CoA dehydrogenase